MVSFVMKLFFLIFLLIDIGISVTREPELQEWVANPKHSEKKMHAITEEITIAIDRFYFNHYCKTFRSGAFARANSSM